MAGEVAELILALSNDVEGEATCHLSDRDSRRRAGPDQGDADRLGPAERRRGA